MPAPLWLPQKISPPALGIHACGEPSQVFLRWGAEKVRHLTIVHVIGAGAGCSRVAAGRLCGGASRLRPPPPRLLFPAAACLHPVASQPAATDAASHLHASAGWPRPLRTLDSAASTACLAPIRRRRGQPLLLATPAPHPPARAASPSLQTSAHRPRPLLALFLTPRLGICRSVKGGMC